MDRFDSVAASAKATLTCSLIQVPLAIAVVTKLDTLSGEPSYSEYLQV